MALPMLPTTIGSAMSPVVVVTADILSIIDSAKLLLLAGVDQIASKILKATKHISGQYLSSLFSRSRSTVIVPHDWKKRNIVPVSKSH